MLLLKSVLFIIVLFTIPTFPVSADSQSKLIVSYGDHNAPPYAIEKGEVLYGGLIKDIAIELADELDIDISFNKTPRKRIERNLENDSIHLVLISNPKWLSNSDKLQWSDTIFVEQDVIVTKAEKNHNYKEVSDLKGKIIGTIRGYSYPTIDALFDKNYFVRYDVSNLKVNLIRLQMNRVDAIVAASTPLNYLLQQSNKPLEFKVLPVSISQHNIRAAFSPNAPISIDDFNQALKKLKDQGIIAAILRKYKAN